MNESHRVPKRKLVPVAARHHFEVCFTKCINLEATVSLPLIDTGASHRYSWVACRAQKRSNMKLIDSAFVSFPTQKWRLLCSTLRLNTSCAMMNRPFPPKTPRNCRNVLCSVHINVTCILFPSKAVDLHACVTFLQAYMRTQYMLEYTIGPIAYRVLRSI